MELTGMAAIVSTWTTIFTGVLTLLGNLITFIMADGHEFLQIGLYLMLTGFVVSIFRRLLGSI